MENGFLTALKPSENDEGVMVRAFDPQGNEPKVKYPSEKIIEVDLAERPIQAENKLKNIRSWLIKVM